MDTGHVIPSSLTECPCCGAKAMVVIDPQDKQIMHIFYCHEPWCSLCPEEAETLDVL